MPGPFQGTSIQGSSTTSFTYSDGAGSASLTGTANRGNNGAGGDAYLQFYFEVVGPSTIVVPLVFDAAGNVSVSLTGESSSQSYATAYAAVAGVSGFDISPFEIAQYYTPGSQ